MRFPGESEEYRLARDDLLAAEAVHRRAIESVAAARRALPVGGEVPSDYAFDEWDPVTGTVKQVLFSELFAAGKDDLFIYSFMFKPGPSGPLDVPCNLCTSIVDGIDSSVPHIAQRINFAVLTKAPIERFSAHARARGWRYARLLSSGRSSFNSDYNAETPEQEQFAMAHTFQRRDGRLHHVWSSEIWEVAPDPGQNPRHVDFMWPLWSVLDTTASGRGTDWWPQLHYE